LFLILRLLFYSPRRDPAVGICALKAKLQVTYSYRMYMLLRFPFQLTKLLYHDFAF
jgi:hypothetical protein